jgi:hypothetical protein
VKYTVEKIVKKRHYLGGLGMDKWIILKESFGNNL